MTRPKDEKDRPLPPPHRRLPGSAGVVAAIVFTLSEDRRWAHLPLAKKMKVAQRAVDHIVDGDVAPGWLFITRKEDGPGGGLEDLWRQAVAVVRSHRAELDRP